MGDRDEGGEEDGVQEEGAVLLLILIRFERTTE